MFSSKLKFTYSSKQILYPACLVIQPLDGFGFFDHASDNDQGVIGKDFFDIIEPFQAIGCFVMLHKIDELIFILHRSEPVAPRCNISDGFITDGKGNGFHFQIGAECKNDLLDKAPLALTVTKLHRHRPDNGFVINGNDIGILIPWQDLHIPDGNQLIKNDPALRRKQVFQLAVIFLLNGGNDLLKVLPYLLRLFNFI